MDYNMPQSVIFKLDGPRLKNNINLYELIISLSEFHSIIDKSYCILTGKQKLSRAEREYFKIGASDFRQGSFLVNLEILVASTQLVLPILGLANPYTIRKYTRYSFEFLKAIYSARQKGEKPQVIAGDNSQVILITGNNNDIILPDVRILDLASRTKSNYAKLAGILSEGGVQHIHIAPSNSLDKGISLKLDEKDLFETLTEIVPEPITFYADIYNFNKNTNRLRVLSGQNVPEGDYSFSVIGSQDTAKYIQSMLHDRINVTALEEQEVDPVEGPKLLRFQIIQVQSTG